MLKRMPMTSLVGGAIAAACGLAVLALAGCVSPGRIDPDLLTRYQEAVLKNSPQPRAGEDGLDLLRPAPGRAVAPLKIVKDPKGGRGAVHLSLDEAIRLALANSLEIGVVGFDPAISRQQMIEAAAAFDYVLFGESSHTRSDRRSPTALAASQTRTVPVKVGVRNTNVYGGVAELSWSLTRQSDNSPFTMPDPRYESITTLQVTQPLLRRAGRDYNLAALHLARLNLKASRAQFRDKVEEIVAQVQSLYWTLVQAREDVRIQQELLDRTVETLDRVRKRRRIDATEVVIKQTEAAAHSRRALLIRSRTTADNVQDQLARLLADERIGIANGCGVKPTDLPVAKPVTIDVASQLVSALRHNPLLEQARLGIAAADVNVRVARNETLPVLNLVASVGLQGLNRHGEKGVNDMLRGHFLDHTVGLTFEIPLGNRAARAALRGQRLRRLKSVTEMRDMADKVAVAVREAVREIRTTFDEMNAQAAAVKASQLQLKALDVLEKKTERLTPVFLQLKLQTQESVARAQRAEIQARVSYHNALVQLTRITGTTLQLHNIRLAVDDSIEAAVPLDEPDEPAPGKGPG